MTEDSPMMSITDDIDVNLSKKLGSGAFGDIYQGVWKSKNRLVAIKIIKTSIKDGEKIIREEIETMRRLSHDNILEILGCERVDDKTYLIIEYCEGGCLAQEIHRSKIPELNCYLYLRQMISAMDSVAQAKHLHRDIKPQNILFTKLKELKICDFGLARMIIGDDPKKLEKYSAKGTPLYASPQVLNGEPYSCLCDVWSVGVVLVEMLTRVNPFIQAKNMPGLKTVQNRILKTGGRYVLEGNYHPWFKEIVGYMMAYDEKDRWSFEELTIKLEKDNERIYHELGSTYKVEGNGEGGRAKIVVNEGKHTKLPVEPEAAMIIRPKPNQVQPQPQPNQSKPQLGTLLSREENKRRLGILKFYVELVYNRGKLFVDFATKYFNSKENPQENGYKFTVLYLGIAVFLKSIEKILKVINNTQEIVFPDNTTLSYQSLDEASRRDYEVVRKQYEKQMNSEKTKFAPTLKMIAGKMTTQPYLSKYDKLLKSQKEIFAEMAKLNNDQSERGVDYFEGKFRVIFRDVVSEPDPSSLTEPFLRTYWMCLNLANIDQKVPLSEFKNTYIINMLIEDYAKLDVDRVLQEANKLTKDLKKA